MYKFNYKKLSTTIEETLINVGLNYESIEHLKKSLIETSLRGVDSHGINLFPHYINAIINKRININPSFSFLKNQKATTILDANHAIGHHSGAVAMKKAVKLAQKYGIGSVAVKNSTHFGAAAYFGMIASENDCIGLSFTNADALVKASNAKESFGTNPICFVAPLLNESPFCLDMATSMISWNKRNQYMNLGLPLNNNWAYDKHGNKVENPSKAVSLSPIGDYKGFGLGMMVDILTSILTNSLISKDIKPMYTSDIKDKRHISHFFIALDIKSFLDLNLFKKNLQDMVDRIRNLDPIDKNNEVMVPGDPEKKTMVKRKKYGIPIDAHTYEKFISINKNFKSCLINE